MRERSSSVRDGDTVIRSALLAEIKKLEEERDELQTQYSRANASGSFAWRLFANLEKEMQHRPAVVDEYFETLRETNLTGYEVKLNIAGFAVFDAFRVTEESIQKIADDFDVKVGDLVSLLDSET